MFKTIILFAGPADHALLSTVLKSFNPLINVVPVFSADDLAAIDADCLRSARLITFARDEDISPAIISKLGYGAYQFMAGTPQYPDAETALDDSAMYFGATVHQLLAGDVDALPVIDIELFAVTHDATLNGLREMSCGVLVNMLLKLAAPLALQGEPLAARASRFVESYTFRNALRSRRSTAALAGSLAQAKVAARGTDFGFAWT